MVSASNWRFVGVEEIQWVYKPPAKSVKFNPNHDNLGRFSTGGGSMAPDTGGGFGGGGGGNAKVELGSDGRGKVETNEDGSTSYGGIHENEWQDWAVYSNDINAAIEGTLKAGDLSDQGEIITEQDVSRFKDIGERIQAAASTNATKQITLYRGESYNNEAEMKAAHSGKGKPPLRRLTSTATSEEAAADYHSSDSSGPVKVLVRFQNPNGIKGIQTAPMGVPSNEVVLPKGDQYKTARIFKRDDGVWVVDKYTAEKHGLQRVDVSNPGGKKNKRYWIKFNPNHGPDGRFSSSGGSGLLNPAATDVYGSTSSAKDISSQVKRTRSLGGGINATHIMDYEDENGVMQRGVFKPIIGESGAVHPAFFQRQSKNEVAASVVDEAMGLGMSAHAEMAVFEGRVGSLSKFINDTAALATNLPDEQLTSAKGFSDMLHYDVLIGNTDRHLGNWLVKDGEVKLIDNGMAFARNRDYEDPKLRFRGVESLPRTAAFQRMSPKFKEGLKRLQDNKESVTAKLKETGLDDEQIRSFWKRADYMQRVGQLGFGTSTLRDIARLSEGKDLFE